MALAFFDAHMHIMDPRFPLSRNQGYLPDPFTGDDYRSAVAELSGLVNPMGGAVVSASFQGFDQSYLLDALENLGDGFVGVTQVPYDYSEAGLQSLHRQRVRAVRFNFRRGGSESSDHLEELAHRLHDMLGWHSEFYIDSMELASRGLTDRLLSLPQICIDHMGMSQAGLPDLMKLVENGACVKATGFSRGDLDWLAAMKQIHAANPAALLFGTDLPSTRAPTPFQIDDLKRVLDAFPESDLRRILFDNAKALYRLAAA